MAQVQMSPQMENQLAQFQQIQQQLQMVATQRVQYEAQSKELEKAIEILEKAQPDVPVYRSVGSILVKGEGRDKVKTELEEQKETLGVRIKTLERQETHLRERLGSLQQQLQKALGSKGSVKGTDGKKEEEDESEEEKDEK